MKFRLACWISLTLCMILLLSCQKEDDSEQLPTRTVIVYMVANNNLDYFSQLNINAMEASWSDKYDGQLLVYVDRTEAAIPAHPITLKVKHDTTPLVVSSIVNIYPQQNSADANVMHHVLTELVAQYPAKSYGLILWSHGTGWLPKGVIPNNEQKQYNRESKQIKTFGRDGHEEMEIKDLAKAIPLVFDFILFDACFMGSIETLYELRNNARCIVASAAEVLSFGVPYDKIIPYLFEQKANLKEVARKYIDFYNQFEGDLQTATIAVVKTKELSFFVDKLRNILLCSPINSSSIDLKDSQQYERIENNLFFDMENVLNKIVMPNDMPTIKLLWENAVAYKDATLNLWGKPIKHFSGVSLYFPTAAITDSSLVKHYKQLSWYENSGIASFW